MSDYRQGFKDGFAAGLEEGKKLNDKTYTDGLIEGMKKTLPPPYVPKETCPKCGITISGTMGYVCQSINCPTYYKTWTSPTRYNEWSAVRGAVWAAGSQGAVGSISDPNADRWTQGYNGGENGPGGPREPIDYSMR